MSLAISEISVGKLRSGEFRETFPEFYRLTTVVENNVGHDQQSVFDHVLSVYEHLLQRIEEISSDPQHGQIFSDYFSETIDIHSRAELLTVMVLLHDIAKPDVVISNPSGVVACPGHELLGAARVPKLGDIFGLTDKEKMYVKQLVAHHGLTNNLVYLAMAQEKPDSAWKLLTESLGELAFESILFEAADLEGGDLKKLDPDHYAQRKRITEKLLALAIQAIVSQK